MKTALCILPFLLFGLIACKHQGIDAEHQKKAEQIIQRIASGKPLPDRIIKPDNLFLKTQPEHEYFFTYFTKRIVNGKEVDSVLMTVQMNDTLNFLDFYEAYFRIHHTMPSYHYCIDNGKLTLADISYPLPDSLQKDPIFPKNGEPMALLTMNMDSTFMIQPQDSLWIHDPVELKKHRERDRRSVAFFEPKLLKAIDELYDILFK